MPTKTPKKLVNIPLSRIRPGKYQPRKSIHQYHVIDIATSLAETGLQEPIIVRASRSEPGCFELVSGEYRWRGAAHLGWETIEACLTEEPDKHIAAGVVAANGQLPLNPIELAEAYARLHDEFSMTHAEIAKACGKGRNRIHVTKTLRMLQLPKAVREWVAEGQLSITQAQILLEAPAEDIMWLAQKSTKFSWSNRRLKEAIEGHVGPGLKVVEKKDNHTIDWLELEAAEMTKQVGIPVAIYPRKQNKREFLAITLECRRGQELENMLQHLKAFSNGVVNDSGNTENMLVDD